MAMLDMLAREPVSVDLKVLGLGAVPDNKVGALRHTQTAFSNQQCACAQRTVALLIVDAETHVGDDLGRLEHRRC